MNPPRTYYNKDGISIVYEAERDLYWLEINKHDFAFDSIIFKDLSKIRDLEKLIDLLNKFCPEMSVIVKNIDYSIIQEALKVTREKEEKEFREFQKQMRR